MHAFNRMSPLHDGSRAVGRAVPSGTSRTPSAATHLLRMKSPWYRQRPPRTRRTHTPNSQTPAASALPIVGVDLSVGLQVYLHRSRISPDQPIDFFRRVLRASLGLSYALSRLECCSKHASYAFRYGTSGQTNEHRIRHRRGRVGTDKTSLAAASLQSNVGPGEPRSPVCRPTSTGVGSLPINLWSSSDECSARVSVCLMRYLIWNIARNMPRRCFATERAGKRARIELGTVEDARGRARHLSPRRLCSQA